MMTINPTFKKHKPQIQCVMNFQAIRLPCARLVEGYIGQWKDVCSQNLKEITVTYNKISDKAMKIAT